MAKQLTKAPSWDAFILYDPTTYQRLGLYGSRREANDDCPGWRDEGYRLEGCVIVLAKGPKPLRPSK